MTTDTNLQTESSYIYQNIQDVLLEYQETGDVDWMPVSCLETTYEEKFKISLNYNSLGVESIEELLTKMYDECMVSLYTDPERKEKYVKYESSYIYQKIQDMLLEYKETVDVDGMPVSCLETTFQEKFKISLNYNSLGVETIEELLTKMCDEGMVSLYTDPERKEKFVKYLPSESDMQTESSYIKRKIQDVLVEYEDTVDVDGMPVSCLETTFQEKFKISLNYNSLGMETIEELLTKMCDEGMVSLYTDPERKEKFVKYACLPTESSDIEDMPIESSDMDVYQQILSILGGCTMGTTLHWLEYRYLYKYGKAPDYDSVGVKDIKDLIDNMRDEKKVLVLEEPEERKETYVMCASYAAQTLWKFLKRDVVKLLEKNGGKIPYSSFERKFKEFFKMELIYPHFGFTSLDNLCEVLNLGLEEADSKGEKVITPCKFYVRKKKITPCKFCVRKKKRNG